MPVRYCVSGLHWTTQFPEASAVTHDPSVHCDGKGPLHREHTFVSHGWQMRLLSSYVPSGQVDTHVPGDSGNVGEMYTLRQGLGLLMPLPVGGPVHWAGEAPVHPYAHTELQAVHRLCPLDCDCGYVPAGHANTHVSNPVVPPTVNVAFMYENRKHRRHSCDAGPKQASSVEVAAAGSHVG